MPTTRTRKAIPADMAGEAKAERAAEAAATKAPAARKPRTRRTLTMTEKGTTLTVEPVKSAAPATTDAVELRRQIKKVRDYRWVVAKNPERAEKLAELDARIADLRSQLDAVVGSTNSGPAWVVTIDPQTGKATTELTEDLKAARGGIAALRAKGLFVTVVAKP